MRCLIVGCGRVGSELAKLLDADGHDVIVVDENPAAFKRLGQRFRGHVVVGTGIDYDVLKRAGAQNAEGFVAVTNGDNRNIMAALIAQRMFRIKRIVARIYDPPRGEMYRELGIRTVCPTTIGAQIIRTTLMAMPEQPQAGCARDDVRSLYAMVGTDHAGKRIADIEQPGRFRIATVHRGTKGTMIAYGELVLEAGDEINALVAADAIAEFSQLFAGSASPARMTA
jgi:trk system potassium uptake protein TrkA